ncbi:MAG: hypothetical protein BGO14_04500 [Chlamydiales bacterium 38-26]|nr:response regulator [Chlamydiales bacterium]OJV07753.1 MAG: hypothetical protein BGO14_04500 [Chlamydiales bacterium 38-26]
MESKVKTYSPHFLCVGLSSFLVSEIIARPEASDIVLDFCKNIPDAKEKISLAAYDIYLFDLNLSWDAVLDLVRSIREKEKKKSLICVLYDVSIDERKRKQMEASGVDVLIPQDEAKRKIPLILDKMNWRVDALPESPIKKALIELKKEYDKTIEQKMASLRELYHRLQKNPDQIHDFVALIHKISGSAGSYGYANVSTLCKNMVQEINEKIAAGSTQDSVWLSTLQPFIENVKEAFKTSTFDEGQLVFQPTIEAKKPLLYLVDNDVDFLDLLERVKEEFSFDLQVEFDPQKAFNKLSSQEFNPQGLVVAQSFRGSNLTGFDLIDLQIQKQISPPSTFTMLLDHESLDVRLEAAKKGISYVFRKPVSVYVLLRAMEASLKIQTLKPTRILILDDDPDFCNFVVAVLSDIGVSATAIQDSSNLFKTLEEYDPQILMLDIMLPNHDGFNLLKTIRQDPLYKNLIILIVTGGDPSDTSLKAYSEDADDVLFKPLDKNILQKRITNIIERRLSLYESSASYTGLMSINDLMEELNACLRNKEEETVLSLFEVNNFNEWVQKNGKVAAKDLIVSISNQLHWAADYLKTFWYKSSLFAILFNREPLDSIERKMDDLLFQIVQSKRDLNLSFNCSLVPIDRTFENASKILQTAEEALYEVRKDIPVNIVCYKPDQRASKKEVVFIDSDEDLLKILKHAFEYQGLDVKVYKEGGEALADLTQRSENQLPSLIIMERNLPDMDGMGLLIKLKNRFRTTIPTFMLTVFSSDKDIEEGIKQGILEYITKPFNISILVEKALRVVERKK